MTIQRLDHVNLRTEKLDAMIDWYKEVLGLEAGRRPDFPFPGAWLYAGEHALVHLVGTDDFPGAGSEQQLKLEHFALSATGRREFEERLTARGEKFSCSEIADFNIVQYNVWDPDGNHIHIDFALNE